MKLPILSLKSAAIVATVAVMGTTAHAQAAAVDPAARLFADSLFAALRHGDSAQLHRFFAPSVRFEGEGRIVSTNGVTLPIALPPTAQRLPQTKPAPTNFVLVNIPGADIAAGYARIVAMVTPARWTGLLDQAKSSLVRVDSAGAVYDQSLAGDHAFMVRLKQPRDPNTTSLDETLVFVVRKVEGRYVVPAHFGDM